LPLFQVQELGDVDPSAARYNKQIFGILDDYYTMPAPDIQDAEIASHFARLKALSGS
jgi:hypothetical protein